jgi:hypothetical protein
VSRNARGFAKLDAFIAKVNKLATGEFHRHAIHDVADVLYDQAAERVVTQRNPWGRPWKPLNPHSKHAGEPPLRITRANMLKIVTHKFAKIAFNFPHAKAHLKGAGNSLRNARTGEKLEHKQMRALKKGEAKLLIAAGELTRDKWKLPARNFIPFNNMPPKWRDAINKKLRERFGKLWD